MCDKQTQPVHAPSVYRSVGSIELVRRQERCSLSEGWPSLVQADGSETPVPRSSSAHRSALLILEHNHCVQIEAAQPNAAGTFLRGPIGDRNHDTKIFDPVPSPQLPV